MAVEGAEETVRQGTRTSLALRLLGPLSIERDGRIVPLPASRKVRALIAYLCLASRPLTRSHLCDLLWDAPNDPRGELRWCLSKIRSLVDEPGWRRVDTKGDAVRLDLSGASIDAVEVANAVQAGLSALPTEHLRALAAAFVGDALAGLDLETSPTFQGWLVAQRRRFRGIRAALLEELVRRAPDGADLDSLEAWLDLAPLDPRVHEAMLRALARQGRLREGDEHVQAAARLFEAEGLDPAPLREAWHSARALTETGATVAAAVAAAPPKEEADGAAPRRASIAVMPFVGQGGAGEGAPGALGDALAYDVITRLAKLRSLFVIAQGTVLALHERRVAPEEAARILNVDYVVCGAVRRVGQDLVVAADLVETRSARIVWAETYHERHGETFAVLDAIGNRIVASVASEIETIERNRAILRPPASLDAWEAHHRGLWHMYRFNRDDNERAGQFFETAIRLDPTFSRAYAGLSFTHFQNAFQGWRERETEIERAIAAAQQGLLVDDRDPAAHWSMGRALWLLGQHEESVVELGQSVDLSPNFALGHYSLAFVHSQSGDPQTAILAADESRSLSPFDPMLFAMFGARAMALARLGQYREAAEWGVKAAARPNAHAQIQAIAALTLALAGRIDDSLRHVAAIRRTVPGYRLDHFFTAMQFGPDGRSLFQAAAKRIGLD